MFRYIKQLRTLGIGETPISVIPSNAFIHTPNLIRLEMSEAAVDAIENGAFQKTPLLQAIILNKNRLSVIRQDLFQGLNDLYSIDLQGNRIDTVEAFGFANLPGLRHLDISYNQLQTMPFNTFNNSFEPIPNDRRVIFACANPWLCDSRLEWFRQILRDNLDIDIDKPECVATCISSINGCPPEGTPLRSNDFCPIFDDSQLQVPLSSGALSFVGWIILAVILTILLISICLLALIRYGMSHRNKKMKENVGGDDQHRIVSSAASVYQASIFDQSHSVGNIGLNLPAAHTLENQPNYFM
uniref:Uncharacterized protein n=1 Tax=Panagrolaimus superbus TaxID=310955 RepID=A0A914XV59_9BILA